MTTNPTGLCRFGIATCHNDGAMPGCSSRVTGTRAMVEQNVESARRLSNAPVDRSRDAKLL